MKTVLSAIVVLILVTPAIAQMSSSEALADIRQQRAARQAAFATLTPEQTEIVRLEGVIQQLQAQIAALQSQLAAMQQATPIIQAEQPETPIAFEQETPTQIESVFPNYYQAQAQIYYYVNWQPNGQCGNQYRGRCDYPRWNRGREASRPTARPTPPPRFQPIARPAPVSPFRH
jgi:hypothetical protein